MLDDVHGGAGQQAWSCTTTSPPQPATPDDLEERSDAGLDAFIAAHGKIVPGFGHRFHPVDPRAPRLLALVDEAARGRRRADATPRSARAVEAGMLRAARASRYR